MREGRYRFSPEGYSPAMLEAGVWMAPEGSGEPIVVTWWPRMHRDFWLAADRWTEDAANRLYPVNPPVDSLRVEYAAKLAEFEAGSQRLTGSEREAYIARNVPPIYRAAIVPARLKNATAFEMVQRWKPMQERPGLVALGDTGRGKTLAVFHRLAALHRATGVPFLAMTADTLKRRAIEAAMDKGDELSEVWSARILFIDDLSQAKLTGHYAETLFAVIEHRTAQRLPCIFTVQMTKAALIRKLAGYEASFLDTAECLARRIEDSCQPVNFGRNEPGRPVE